jgi:hypothetical protein
MSFTPPVPVYRIQFNYVVSGLTHNAAALLDVVAAGASFNTVPASGASVVDWKTAADGWWNAVGHVLDVTGTSFGSAILSQYVGGSYVPVDSFNTSVTPGSGGAFSQASQGTYFFRGHDYSIYKLVLLEAGFQGYEKSVSYAGLTTADKAVVDAFQVLDTTGVKPSAWTKSHRGAFVSQWRSFTFCLNRRERRRRGIL